MFYEKWFTLNQKTSPAYSTWSSLGEAIVAILADLLLDLARFSH